MKHIHIAEYNSMECINTNINEDIVLLKGTSAYPALLEEENLAEIFDVVSGLSDHTLGSTAPIAVAIGVKVIEKHFLIDKSIGGANSEFSDIIKVVLDIEQMLGQADYSMIKKKIKSRQFSLKKI